MSERPSDFAYLDTMNEVLTMAIEFAEEARNSEDDARMGAYLRMASRCLRCAMELYGEHLALNRAEMKRSDNDDVSRNGDLQ